MSEAKKVSNWVYVLAFVIFVVSAIIGYFISTNYWFTDEKKEYAEKEYMEEREEYDEGKEYEEYESKEDKNETGAAAPALPAAPNNTINKEELSKHNTNQDCYVVYKGVVYDVTAWLGKHPGGAEKIAQFCGTEEFEQGFVKKHKAGADKKLNEAISKGYIKAVGKYQN